jgi:hypothetical protein
VTEAVAPETPGRRGRPRPDTTINRDEQVATLLTYHPNGLTRQQIADELTRQNGEGAAPVTGAIAYLSIYRLDGKTVWKLIPPTAG